MHPASTRLVPIPAEPGNRREVDMGSKKPERSEPTEDEQPQQLETPPSGTVETEGGTETSVPDQERKYPRPLR